jgi:uncharacterized protein YecT (DUF1311 family)
MAAIAEQEALIRVRVEAAEAVRQMEAVAGKVRGIGDVAANTSSKMTGMQRGVQNTAYQLQDFVVQTTMGTDALRAFAQQAPQILGGFGALGAVVGILAALAPAVVTLFKSLEDGAKSVEEATKGWTDANALLKESYDFADRSTFDPLIESYKKADAETKKLILSNMELSLTIAKVAAKDLQNTLINSIEDGINKLGFFNRLLLETKKYLDDNERAAQNGSKNPFAAKAVGLNSPELLTEGFGISQDQLKTIQESQKQLEAANITATEFFVTISKVYNETKKPTKEFTEWVQGVQKVAKATKEAELAQKEYNAALNRLNNGDTSTVKSMEEAKKEAEKAQKEWEKTRDKEIDSIQKEFDALERLSVARTKEADQLRSMSDPMAAYNLALEKARILLNDNKISIEEYDKALYRAETTLANSNRLVNGFGDSLTNAFTGAMLAGKSFGDVMKGLANDIQATIIKIMVIEPMIRSLKLAMVNSGYFGTTYNQNTAGFIGPPVPSANGNVFSGGNVIPFASGGVVSRPTYFPMSRGKTGLAGEAGAEGILPLKRGADGKLGVTASGMSGGGTVVNIFNQGNDQVETNTRQDANGASVIDVYIKKAVAEGIASGQFDKAMGTTYGLRRNGTR